MVVVVVEVVVGHYKIPPTVADLLSVVVSLFAVVAPFVATFAVVGLRAGELLTNFS